MKKNTSVVGILLLLCLHGTAQTIIGSANPNYKLVTTEDVTITNAAGFVSLPGGQIETTGIINLNAATLDMGNITLKARKIIIAVGVTTIRISNTVKLECDILEILGTGNLTFQSTGPGALTFLYRQLFLNTSNRTIIHQPLNGQTFAVKYQKGG